MAKHNRPSKASLQPQAPALVLGVSLAKALATTPTNVVVPPGAMATPSTTSAPAQAAAAAAPVHPTAQVVALGKPYNVRAGTALNNVRSWGTLVAYLQANGGTATVAAIAAHLGQAHNHPQFATYCLRRGYLAPVQATPTTAKA